jgi:hypothetical protein
LRAGLLAELHALLDLYESNLALLARKADYLLSSRPLVAIYKGNLGRVTAQLDSDVVGKVVVSFAQSEKIESLLTARTQPKGGLSYKIESGDFDFEELSEQYEKGKRAILSATQALQNAEKSEPFQSPAARQAWALVGMRRAY